VGRPRDNVHDAIDRERLVVITGDRFTGHDVTGHRFRDYAHRHRVDERRALLWQRPQRHWCRILATLLK
jgi:hypothetical protein